MNSQKVNSSRGYFQKKVDASRICFSVILACVSLEMNRFRIGVNEQIGAGAFYPGAFCAGLVYDLESHTSFGILELGQGFQKVYLDFLSLSAAG